jgi:hypothetical protein
MSTDSWNAGVPVPAGTDSVWSRSGGGVVVEPVTPGPAEAAVETTVERVGGTPRGTRAVVSAPALALAAFAFACAQLMGGFVPAQLAPIIPSAADSPGNHVRIMALINLGMAGIAAVLAAAAFVRMRPLAGGHGAPWAAWVAGAAVLLAGLIAFQSLVLVVLSVLAPAGGR